MLKINAQSIKVRWELNEEIKQQVFSRLGTEDLAIQRYSKAFYNEKRRLGSPLVFNQFIKHISDSKFILLADFHALQQSQKTLLRIARRLCRSVQSQVVIALECFNLEHQKHLDEYLSGNIDIQRFKKLIKWEENWGFTWSSTEPLLIWCQENNIKILALNSMKASSLYKRDQLAVQLLIEDSQKHAETMRYLVLYGELHLANNYIPSLLKKKLSAVGRNEKVIRVLQNLDREYFKAIKKFDLNRKDIFKLGKSDYCILNVPPWIKWQSYLIHLEESLELDSEFDQGVDYTDTVSKYVNLLAKELQVHVPLSHLTIYSSKDFKFWKKAQKSFSQKELSVLKYLISKRTSFYSPQLGAGYLAQATMNHISAVAMQYIHTYLMKIEKSQIKLPFDFKKLVWLEAISYFGTKIINPKRKTDTFVDLSLHLNSKKKDLFLEKAYRLALQYKFYELFHDNAQKINRIFKGQSIEVIAKSAYILGDILGEKLFVASQKGKLGNKELLRLLKFSVESKQFESFYQENVQFLDTFPLPFTSKFEKV